MAGINSGFPTADVRAALKGAMQMGAANTPSQRVTFYMPVVEVYNTGVDGAGLPFDPDATLTSDPTPVTHQVDCAVEFNDINNEQSAFGALDPADVVLTLLDVDYAIISGFDYVTIRERDYIFQHEFPVIALFDMDVHRLVVRAKESS